MHQLSWILTVLGAITLLAGLGHRWIERGPFPAPLLALLLGVLLGPQALDLFDLRRLGAPMEILHGATRVALGVGLVGVALRIPREYPRQHLRELSLWIVLAMLGMWLVSGLLVHLLLGLPFWLSALIGAIITPTDPVAASTIVSGATAEENVPAPLRDSLSFESGANDGLAYPFVFLPFLMLTREPGQAISHWLVHTVAWEVVCATAIGLLLGAVAGNLFRRAVARGALAERWRLAYSTGLALLAVGTGTLIGTDEILVDFAAGGMFVQAIWGEEGVEALRAHETINRFVEAPIFVLLGIAIPWAGWTALGWRGLLLAALILLLRRPPVVLLLRPLIAAARSRGDALFMGWFGPIAISATYYAAVVQHRLGGTVVWDVVSLVISASVLAHGMTSGWLTRLYGRKVGLRKSQIPLLAGETPPRPTAPALAAPP